MKEDKKFLLRLKPELWDELQAWAGDEMRSVNGQIEYLLREAVRARRKHPAAESAPPEETGTPAPPAPPHS